MTKKQVIITSITLIVILILGWVFYYFFLNQDEKSTLTIVEKKWIEKNKNNIVDIGIINNIPIFNYDGEGVFFEFIKKIEKDTGLEFNEISYDLGSTETPEYAFKIKEKADDNDISIYEDNYAIVSKNKVVYNDLEDIPAMTIGVTKNNLENINFYLYDNKNIQYKVFDNETSLFNEINSNNSSVQAIVVPKTIYLNYINKNKLNINYNITDAKLNFVLSLGNEKKLNTIIRKYYKKWYKDEYKEQYNKYFLSNYFNFNNIYEDKVAKFRSKQYNYGFISYAPFSTSVDGKLVGISNEYMSQFASLANIEIKYKEYKSLHDLIKDFNENKVDLFFNTSSQNKFDMDVYNTISAVDENISIVTHENNDIIIKSLSSLKDKEVYVIAGSQAVSHLKGYGIVTREVNNFDNILDKLNEDSIIAIDTKAFDIYRHNKLDKFKIAYSFSLKNNYSYAIRDIKDNEVFSKFFNFYISFVDGKKIENNVTYDMYVPNVKNHLLQYLLGFVIGCGVVVAGITVIVKKPFKRNRKSIISKENKIKYIDMLTSLKNRNYLNSAIEKWDESEIYPQTIMIIDLNNIAYINDNYGHEEGDNVIKQAANILITTQVENSEIMRTNGNEFLIYMVNYDEKQVITYIRKLTKEFKELSHGFGAAIGYSMIIDGLKTIDDAINEATLDMKSNKEEISD
ncbi:MAG: GGDEF domain-containing protein [Bacilli bacterium]